jgi:hypothetical protein
MVESVHSDIEVDRTVCEWTGNGGECTMNTRGSGRGNNFQILLEGVYMYICVTSYI